MFFRVWDASFIAIAGLGVAPAIAVASQYENCSEANADGGFNIPEGDPDY